MPIIIIIALLAGCAAEPVIQSASPRSVTVTRLFSNDEKAMAAAESHCQKQGLHAQVKQDDNRGKIVFDCVP